ncbi:MAG: hypothetical protein PHR06_13655 [Candidatus Cloacimonetes bacterium]|nr:hypothetical protein [Candidatus Cloacimonadota bacterium]
MMTGTDLMVKLNNDNYQRSYRIQQAIVSNITNHEDPLNDKDIENIQQTLSSTLNN